MKIKDIITEEYEDDVDNIYALHPDPEQSDAVAFLITDVDSDEFDDRWARLPMPYLNEFGGDLPLWDQEDLRLYPNIKVRALTFDQYVKILTDYIRSEDLAGSALSKMQGSLNESTFQEHEEQLRDFVKWCVRKLNIEQQLPQIRFQDVKEGPDQHRTGYYDDNDDIMWIYTGNRNLIDIMRTVAHELVHRKQHEDNRVHGDQSYPGSPIEQEADAVAGYLMKLYGKDNPEIIE